MTHKKEYNTDHKLAKVIVCIIVIGLLAMGEMLHWYEIAAVVVWIFGVNFIGKIIEVVLHHTKKHDWF